MRYAALGPGDRLHGVLCLATCHALCGDEEAASLPACTLEMAHAANRCHAPSATERDDPWQSRPTVSEAFGKSIAALAGDALLAYAFSTLVAPAVGAVPEASRALGWVQSLGEGVAGDVAGWASEALALGGEDDLDSLETVVDRKTGALFAASVRMGAIAAGAGAAVIDRFGGYGTDVGPTFALVQKALDADEPSRKRVASLARRAVTRLTDLPDDAGFLRAWAERAVERL